MAGNGISGEHGSRLAAAIVARDEWPLLGVTVVHLMRMGFDEVYIFDHASVDDTRQGLRILNQQYPGRIHVTGSRVPTFQQEGATALLVEMATTAGCDWIYVADADEFLIVNVALQIREILATVSPQTLAIRYRVDNWIAPIDFDDSDLSSYDRLRYRAIVDPNALERVALEDRREAMATGRVNFFEMPFNSKVLFRSHPDIWLAQGSHNLVWPKGAVIDEMPPSVLRAAHLPMLSRRRFDMRGSRSRWMGGSPTQSWSGWQQKAIADAQQRGSAEEVWRRHSIDETDGSGPAHFNDAALSATIAPVAEELMVLMSIQSQTEGSTEPEVDTVPTSVTVAAIERHQRIARAMRQSVPTKTQVATLRLRRELRRMLRSTRAALTARAP